MGRHPATCILAATHFRGLQLRGPRSDSGRIAYW